MASRAFHGIVSAAVILVVLVVLMALMGSDLGGSLPRLQFRSASELPEEIVPISRLEPLFDSTMVSTVAELQSLANPFATDHFRPPAPKPATTETHSLTYHGYFETADGDRQAFIRIGESMQSLPRGATVLRGFQLKAIDPAQAVVADGNAEVVLPFNQSTDIEVPAP